MSREAMKWLTEQFAEDSGTQLLLHLLAWRADEDGGMPPLNLAYLARHSRLSERSIRRKLRELEDAGVFTRQMVYGAAGREGFTGTLNLASRLDAETPFERAAMQNPRAEEEAEADGLPEGADAESVPANLAATESVPAKQGGGSGQTGGGLRPGWPEPPLSKENIKTLKGAPAGADARERELSEKSQQRFSEFQRRFPFQPWMSATEARRAFAALSAADREAAVRWAPDYAASLLAAKRRSTKNAADWLADRDFEGVAALAQVAAEKAGLKAPMVFVRKGTPAWEAWSAVWRRETWRSGEMFSARVGEVDGAWRPTLFPPAAPAPATGPPDEPAVGGEEEVRF